MDRPDLPVEARFASRGHPPETKTSDIIHPMETAALIEKWRSIIVGDEKSWVLFAHGTCVILMQPGDDLAGQATELLREHGPVAAGGRPMRTT